MHANAVLYIKDDLILAINRNKKPLGWALPGGKREPYDIEAVDGAQRELREETGIFCWSTELQEFFTGTHEEFEATVFLLHGDFTPDFSICDEGDLAWKRPQDLLDGPFSDFYREMFQNLPKDHPWVTEGIPWEIPVTQDEITYGAPGSSKSCPIGLGAYMGGLTNLTVYPERLWFGTEKDRVSIPTPPRMKQWILMFDAGIPVQSETFKIRVPLSQLA